MNIHQEISRMKASGHTMEDTYILVKDYVSLEQFVELYEVL